MRSVRRAGALLVSLALVTGCARSDSGAHGGRAQNPSYDAAFDICKPGVKPTAQLYAVPPTEGAVLEVVVQEVAGGNSENDPREARRGCLDALRQAGEQ